MCHGAINLFDWVKLGEVFDKLTSKQASKLHVFESLSWLLLACFRV
jgi:hypothetical protein